MYANNSLIDINLLGEGFEGAQITDGGALECHTDDTTCCRGIDNPNGPGRGEWYYPNGTVVPPPGNGNGIYRTRDHMVVRLNRIGGVTRPIGVYRCEIPGAIGGNIIRYITMTINGMRIYSWLGYRFMHAHLQLSHSILSGSIRAVQYLMMYVNLHVVRY